MRRAQDMSERSAAVDSSFDPSGPVPANDNDPFDPPPAARLRAPRPLQSLTVCLSPGFLGPAYEAQAA